MRSKVDLPAPERPITPTSWPVGTASDTWSTARLSPKLLVTPSSRSTGYPREASSSLGTAAGCTKATVRYRNPTGAAANKRPVDKVLQGQTAIHMDGLARNVARTGRATGRRSRRRLRPSCRSGRSAPACSSPLCDHVTARRGRRRLLDQAGRHAIGRGTRWREIDGHRAGKGLDSGLGRRRGGNIGRPRA